VETSQRKHDDIKVSLDQTKQMFEAFVEQQNTQRAPSTSLHMDQVQTPLKPVTDDSTSNNLGASLGFDSNIALQQILDQLHEGDQLLFTDMRDRSW
jgi:hypothetical protein